ncbi:MAG: hypothetical protein K6D94_05750 [Clostridiales bacterium]|nr:hypothetical protein [Clostridiales bacterium]
MSKKNVVMQTAVFLIFAALLIGGILKLTAKPDLYYPGISSEDRERYSFLKDRFNLIQTMDITNCSAKKGDFAVMFELERYDAERELKIYNAETSGYETYTNNPESRERTVEQLARQGAYVVLIHRYDKYFGTLYKFENGEISTKSLSGDTAQKMSARMASCVDRSPAAMLLIAAALILCYFICSTLFLILKTKEVLGSARDGTVEAAVRLPRGKYIFSIIAAVMIMLGTLAWLIAPNITELLDNRFEPGVLIASLFSLPFLLISLFNIFNLAFLKKYRRWLNILCIVVFAVLYGFLLFGLIMMLFT